MTASPRTPWFRDTLSMATRRRLARWLFVMCGLVALMVVVGGATRLTDSGLSITEWRPVTGIVPPLTEAGWLAEKEKYKQIPEYQLVNKGMTLAEFKAIYWWEWGHRFLGRLLGLAFLVPALVFFFSRQLTRPMALRLAGLFALGGLQGFVGWFMVQSGLVDRVDVSQYRLVLHLGLAVALFGLMLVQALALAARPADGTAAQGRPAVPRGLVRGAFAFAGLVYLQILAGGFVAGLDAGYSYNQWPLMAGQIVPEGIAKLEPLWLNAFENRITVQFNHRLIAYGIFLAALALLIAGARARLTGSERRPLVLLFAAVLAQIGLGIWTLLAVVPIGLGLAHQAGALALFALSLHAAMALQLSRRSLSLASAAKGAVGSAPGSAPSPASSRAPGLRG